MVVNFIDEYKYLALTPEEKAENPAVTKSARALFEYRGDKEGYWTDEKFMAQVKNVCDIAEAKYRPSQHIIVFVFYQSRCHTKYDDHALLVKSIIVSGQGVYRRWCFQMDKLKV